MEPNQSKETVLSKNALAIDHIALCVEDLEESIRFYTTKLGFSLVDRLDIRGESTGMISAVLKAGPVVFVLCQGTSPDSQVSRFIENFGPGVQHVALAVEDLGQTFHALEERGIPAETEVIEGEGIKQIFTKREPHMGVRLEFVERRGGSFTPQSVEKLFRTMEQHGAY